MRLIWILYDVFGTLTAILRLLLLSQKFELLHILEYFLFRIANRIWAAWSFYYVISFTVVIVIVIHLNIIASPLSIVKKHTDSYNQPESTYNQTGDK